MTVGPTGPCVRLYSCCAGPRHQSGTVSLPIFCIIAILFSSRNDPLFISLSVMLPICYIRFHCIVLRGGFSRTRLLAVQLFVNEMITSTTQLGGFLRGFTGGSKHCRGWYNRVSITGHDTPTSCQKQQYATKRPVLYVESTPMVRCHLSAAPVSLALAPAGYYRPQRQLGMPCAHTPPIRTYQIPFYRICAAPVRIKECRVTDNHSSRQGRGHTCSAARYFRAGFRRVIFHQDDTFFGMLSRSRREWPR